MHDIVHVLDGELDTSREFFLEKLVDSDLTGVAIYRCAIVIDCMVTGLPTIRRGNVAALRIKAFRQVSLRHDFTRPIKLTRGSIKNARADKWNLALALWQS